MESPDESWGFLVTFSIELKIAMGINFLKKY